jgi:hypothetical protein
MAEYKIDFNRGDDSNNGTSAPWKNLSKLAALTPAAGDIISLASDSIWPIESRILLPAHTNGTRSSPILFTSYDPAGATGTKPTVVFRKTLAAGDFTYEAGSNGWYFDTSAMVGTGSLSWTCFVRLGGEDGLRQESFTPNVTPLESIDLTWQSSARLFYVYAPAGTNPVDYYGSVEFGHSSGALAFVNSGNFVIFDGLKASDGGTLVSLYASSGVRNVIFRNIESDDATATIRTLHDTGSNLTVDVEDCRFNESQSVHIATFSNGALSGGFSVRNSRFVGGNRGYPQGQVYLQTRLGSNIVSGNVFSGARYGTVHHQADGCAVYAEGGADNVIVTGNQVTDTYLAFQDNSGRGAVWAENLIANCQAAIKVTDETNVGSTNHRFYNNTCLVGAGIQQQGPLAISGTGWRCYKASGSAMTVNVRNNIIWDQRTGGNTYGAAILTPQVTYTGTFANNCLRGFPATGAAEFGGTEPTVTGSVTDDPLLSGYRLTASSPCRGAGVYIPGAKHFGGNSMSVVSPDIGAFRYFAERVSANRMETPR